MEVFTSLLNIMYVAQLSCILPLCLQSSKLLDIHTENPPLFLQPWFEICHPQFSPPLPFPLPSLHPLSPLPSLHPPLPSPLPHPFHFLPSVLSALLSSFRGRKRESPAGRVQSLGLPRFPQHQHHSAARLSAPGEPSSTLISCG